MQNTYFKNNLIENMFSFCFLFLIHINVHSCKPREDEEEACSKRGIGGRSALAVRTFPHCSYSLYSAQCTARRRGSGGVTAVAAPAVALARSVAAAAVSQQRQTLHWRSSLPSRNPTTPLHFAHKSRRDLNHQR